MMKALLKKFGGAIFFYIAIVGMILIVNYRFSNLNVQDDETLAVVID